MAPTCRCAPLRCAIKRNVRQMIFLASGSKSCLVQQPTNLMTHNLVLLFPPNLPIIIQHGMVVRFDSQMLTAI